MPDDDRSLSPDDEVEHAIQRAIHARPGVLSAIASAHAAGGKRLRARLAQHAARALDAPDATRWAAAVEVIHEASLLHDDLQDGDRVRRGRPAAWVEHGPAQAINAGDFLLLVPFTTLRAEPHAELLMDCLARAATDMARGQAEEPFLVDVCARAPGEAEAAYRACIEKKTGALFGAAVEGAALLAGAGGLDAAALARPFITLGALFQIVDDVVDLYGDKGRDKRGNDIREGKASALVVAHLRLHPGDAGLVTGVLRTPREETGDDVVDELADLFRDLGALDLVLGSVDAGAAAVLDDGALAGVPALRRVAAGLLERIRAPLASIGGAS